MGYRLQRLENGIINTKFKPYSKVTKDIPTMALVADLWGVCVEYCEKTDFLFMELHGFPLFRYILGKNIVNKDISLTLSQCTLAGPVYTGMPRKCHWLTQCTLGYHWAIPWILAGYTGTPLEKLSWNSPHWKATGEALTFAAYTGTPLEGLWQPTQAPTHIIKHAE